VSDQVPESIPLPAPIDLAELGRRLRAARTIAGYDRMTDLATAIEDISGVSVSARSLYAIERGEQMPSFEQVVCIMAALPDSEQRLFVEPAIRDDISARLWFTGRA
jgi:transcriptional regulator with XRE-family HTH domain